MLFWSSEIVQRGKQHENASLEKLSLRINLFCELTSMHRIYILRKSRNRISFILQNRRQITVEVNWCETKIQAFVKCKSVERTYDYFSQSDSATFAPTDMRAFCSRDSSRPGWRRENYILSIWKWNNLDILFSHSLSTSFVNEKLLCSLKSPYSFSGQILYK